MFVGYQPEYRWVLSYGKTYGCAPSKDALLTKFPDFPLTEHRDAAFAADEVRYNHNQRMLRTAIRTASQHISEGDYDEAAMAIATYAPIAPARTLTNTLHDLSFLDAYHERVSVMEVPWPSLHRRTGGMRLGDLWYVAARTNQGKSWMLAKIIAHAVKDGLRVRFYSLEMSEEQVRVRMHVVLGKMLGFQVNHIKMRDRDFDHIEYRKLVNRIRDEIPGELLVHDSSKGRVSPATVMAHAEGTDLNVVDYVGLMHSPMGARSVEDWRTLAAISNELKEVAVAGDTRVLAASQVNREGDTPGKYPPKLRNLAGSDSLGQDGDVVITMKQFSRSVWIFSVEKNRHGEKDLYTYTRFLPNTGEFEEISKDRAEAIRDEEMN